MADWGFFLLMLKQNKLNWCSNFPFSMRKIKLFLFPVLLFYSCGPIFNVISDQDNTVDFTQYKTFAWYVKEISPYKNDLYNNQIIESNVKNLVSAELKRRGFTVNTQNPDLIFDYEIVIEKKTEQVQTPVYSHPYNYGYPNMNMGMYGYNSPGVFQGYQTQNVPYKEGTLSFKAVDKKTNRLIWQGYATETVPDPQTYESQLPQAIREIFKKFPVKFLNAPQNYSSNKK